MGQSRPHTLPPELVQSILDALLRADLPSARLVNKTFASLAAPRLFQKIPLWISIRSLESLNNLAANEHLRGFVEEIVFSPLWLNNDLIKSRHFAEVQASLEHETDSLNAITLRLGRYRAASHRFTEAQRYLSEDDRGQKLLARALRGFPNLGTVTLCPHNLEIGSKELIHAFGRFMPGDILSNAGVRTVPTLVGALAASGVKLTKFTIGSPDDFSMRCKQDLGSVPLKGSNAGIYVKYPHSLTPWALTQAFLVPDQADKIKQIFDELHTLHVAHLFVKTGDSDGTRHVARAIQSIISVAPQLENLKADEVGDVFLQEDSQRIFLYDLIREHVDLRRIQYLDLSGICASALAFTNFFKRRARTLIEVEFHYVDCKDGQWEQIVTELRDLAWPRLEWFFLDNCQDPETSAEEDVDVSNIAVTDYLCRRTDRNPRKKPYVYYST